jgi:hypothetical protein
MQDNPKRTILVRRIQGLLGLLFSSSCLIVLAEFGLQVAPPASLKKYEENEAKGSFVADAEIGLRYRDFAELQQSYDQRFKELGWPLPATRPIWAMFGNSFVQAGGMLADTANREQPDHLTFHLARNESLPIRIAQIEILLQNGFRPERIFFVLLPIELLPFIDNSLDQLRIGSNGAIFYAMRKPSSVLGELLESSRLLQLAWLRMKLHQAEPFYSPTQIPQGMTEGMKGDFDRLFQRLGKIESEFRIPITIVLIPSHEMIIGKAPMISLEQLQQLASKHLPDVVMVRDVFVNYPNKAELFIPDKHFSETGNHLLLQSLINHIQPESITR